MTSFLDVVVDNSCGESRTYQTTAERIVLLSEGDTHDRRYDDVHVSSTNQAFAEFVRLSSYTPLPSHEDLQQENGTGSCTYRYRIYPTSRFESKYDDSQPTLYVGLAAAVLVFSLLAVFAYDCMVQREHLRVLKSAEESNEIVESLFPKSFKQRLFDDRRHSSTKSLGSKSTATNNSKRRNALRTFLDEAEERSDRSPDPIAELFAESSVMFLDIAGFTAWSSEREPNQVFLLLETIYGEFDDIARKRGVFKVETIGDCYVAVTGVPDPMVDHASGKGVGSVMSVRMHFLDSSISHRILCISRE
jgi:Adenylate and Guanylate cyclase catalytic domain